MVEAGWICMVCSYHWVISFDFLPTGYIITMLVSYFKDSDSSIVNVIGCYLAAVAVWSFVGQSQRYHEDSASQPRVDHLIAIFVFFQLSMLNKIFNWVRWFGRLWFGLRPVRPVFVNCKVGLGCGIKAAICRVHINWFCHRSKPKLLERQPAQGSDTNPYSRERSFYMQVSNSDTPPPRCTNRMVGHLFWRCHGLKFWVSQSIRTHQKFHSWLHAFAKKNVLIPNWKHFKTINRAN